MDDSVKRQMHVGVGLDVTDAQGGLDSVKQKVNDINSSIQELARSASEAEKTVGNLSKGLNNSTNNTSSADKATKDFVKTLKNEVLAGQKTATQAFQELEKEKQRLTKILESDSFDKNKDAENYKSLVSELASINKQLNASMVAEQKAAETQKRAEVKKTTAEIKANYKEIETAGKQLTTNLNASFKAVNTAYASNNKLGNTMFNTAMQVSGVRQLASEIQNLGTALVDINYNTINNQRLMGDFSTSLRDKLNASAVEIAKNSGTLITDAQQIEGAWIRINDQYAKSPKLLSDISDTTSKFMSVGEITDAESAVKLLNSSLLQFNLAGSDAAKNAETIANKFAYMADKTAMGTADEYAESIAKMGANIRNMNGDIDDAIVMTSIIGDKLAKNGQEAGNALNTFTAYMQRAKTLNLFDDLADQLGDTNIRIREGDKGLKDFKGTLEAISSAYSQLKSQGDQQGMNKIIEALGATRQRATAQALLDAISSDDGQNLEYYYQLLTQATAQGSYLEQQNEVLMTSLKKQFNVFVASIQEAGMAWGNSGILDGASIFLKGINGIVEVIGKIPAPIMSAVSAFLALKGGLLAFEKIGDITGLTDRFTQAMNGGTKASRDVAEATAKTTQAFISEQQMMFSSASASDKLTASYQAQYTALNDFKASMIEHNKAYAEGAISAAEYNARVQESTNAYRNSMQYGQMAATTDSEVANAKKRVASATKEQNVAENLSNRTKKEKIGLLASEKVQEMAKNGYTKAGTVAQTARNAVETLHNGILKVRAVLTGQATVAETADTTAKTAGTVATGGLTAATTALGVALNFLLSPMVLITAAIAGISWLMGQSSAKTQELQEDIDNLTTTVNESKERIAELKDQQQRSGLSGYEEQELDYLQKKVDLEEQSLKIKQQEKNADDWFGNHHTLGNPFGLGGSNNLSEDVKDSIADFKEAKNALEDWAKYADASGKSIEELGTGLKTTAEYTEEMNSAAAELVQYRSQLEGAINGGMFSPEYANQAKEMLASLDEISPEIEDTINSTKELSDATASIDTEGFKTLTEDLKKSRQQLEGVNSDILELSKGNVTADYLLDLADKYEGFSEVAGKSTKEQIEFLRDYQSKLEQTVVSSIDSKIDELNKTKESLENKLQGLKDQKLGMDDSEVLKATESLRECENKLQQLELQKDIQLNISLNNALDFSSFVNSMDELVNSTKDLTQAQYDLQNGTALSQQELWNLCQTYPELLYQANLFADGSVSAQESAINAVLGMKQQEFDSTIDQKIAELQAEKTKLENQIDIEGQQKQILLDLDADEANGKINTEQQLQDKLTQFNNLEMEKYAQKTNDESNMSQTGAQNMVNSADQASLNISSMAVSVGNQIMTAIDQGASSGANSLATNANSGQISLSALASQAHATAEAIQGAFQGEVRGSASIRGMVDFGKSLAGAISQSYRSIQNGYKGGTSIKDIQNANYRHQKEEELKADIEAAKLKVGQLNNAIANLEAFKNAGLSNIANNLYPDKSTGGSSHADKAAKQAAKDAEKAAKEAEKAAKEAAKAAEEERKAIEQIRESYIKNVEDLQDRIAKALKKKYQQQFDERKKLLEKEHEARVKQIQDEIDRLNGDRPEDKKNKLAGLKEKLEKWKKDDSTLGKQKQKEYMDQIKDLEKEIKIDELESQLDDENKKFDTLIDTENANCDKILATLTQKMDDEHIYKEANDMITNGKMTEIVDLLTTYDAKWDGWATLMGQSAGQIIADQVKVAMANYVDVLKNSITSNGGVYTNQVTGNTSKPSTNTSKPSTNTTPKPTPAPKPKTVKIGSKVKISDTSAGMFYTSTSKGAVNSWRGYNGSYYVVNDAAGRVAIARDKNINNAIGWIDKKKVVAMRTGGYTGNQEGLAMLHKNERILNSQQTTDFHELIDFLPKMRTMFTTSNDMSKHQETNINAPLVNVHVDKVEQNTKTDMHNDMDNLNRMVRKSLRRSGTLIKK